MGVREDLRHRATSCAVAYGLAAVLIAQPVTMSYGINDVDVCTPRLQRICVEAEQIITESTEQAEQIHLTLRNAKEPMSTFVKASSRDRPFVVVAKPGDRYSYLPLGVASRYVRDRPRQRQALQLNHTIAGARFDDTAVGLIFYPTFPASFAESFSRTVSRVFQALEEIHRREPGKTVHLIPALWRRQLLWLLTPFSEAAVSPLALLPNLTKTGRTKMLFEGRSKGRTWRMYLAEHSAYVEAHPPRCFGSAYVCDLHASVGRGVLLGTKHFQAQWHAAQRIASAVSKASGLAMWHHELRSQSTPMRLLFARAVVNLSKKERKRRNRGGEDRFSLYGPLQKTFCIGQSHKRHQNLIYLEAFLSARLHQMV